MTLQYEFRMYVTVTDEAALLKAALNRAINTDGLSEEEARDILVDDDGDPRIPACIQTLADPGVSWPGTEIEESNCE